ncbi:MAG: hypothetical protein ACYTG6_15345 [Planctomycetota bacterium]|jgi:hypothetical protein
MTAQRGSTWGSPGRVRVVLTILLALLIGAAGAILLPRIVQEDRPPGDDGRGLTTIVPRDGMLASAGTLSLTAGKTGLPALGLELSLTDGMDQAAVMAAVSEALAETPWRVGTDYVVVERGIRWIGVNSLGGSTTIPGLIVTLNLQ